MNKRELGVMADVMRRDVLKMTTAAGSGHPTSCLSAAEIMSVLFFNQMRYDVKNAFDPDNDEFILSKGHAAPILYSALYRAGAIRTDLMSLRKLSSPLEGHPVPRSMKWAKVATGSLGQGLSVGVGMALALKMQKRKARVYVLCGDSEMAEGSIYEALQLGAHYRLSNLCLIVDMNRLGQRGKTILGRDAERLKKEISSFGWAASIVNGHDVEEIEIAFRKSDSSPKPFAIIARTSKGKGVSFLEAKEGWHGRALVTEELERALREIPDVKIPRIRIAKPAAGRVAAMKSVAIKEESYHIGEMVATREAYGSALAALATADPRVIAIDGEVSNSTYSDRVKKVRPEQFVEAYIAEQNLVGMALGLSKKGFRVFGSSFAAFLSRAHDQIRMAAVSDANVSLCGSHAGVSIGEDGVSQMGLEDIAMFRALPGSTIFYPSDSVSTWKLMKLAAKNKGVTYIRTTRRKTPTIYGPNEKFPIGGFKVVRSSGKDKAVIVGAGVTLHEALKAHEELQKKKINVAVVDIYCVKPFDEKRLAQFVKKHGGKVVVAEDHYAEGGIGEMLADTLENEGVKLKHLAIREVPHSGKSDELLEKYKIDWKAIMKAAA